MRFFVMSRQREPMDADLEPGWLKRHMDDVAAHDRAEKKIIRAADAVRRNGYTQPVAITLTVPELRALAYMARINQRS